MKVRVPTAREVAGRLVPRRVWSFTRRAIEHTTFPSDFTPDEIALFQTVAPFTMTSPERVLALRDATRAIVRNEVPGDVVECGVWRGGSMMVVANELTQLAAARELHLFDTFEGMPAAGEHDTAASGETAESILRRQGNCEAAESEVRKNLDSTGYPAARVHLVRGRVEQTIPQHAPAQIALLRLDTDWYESTLHELVHLYPRLSPGGVLIIDDYGYWQGARRAVDEYFAGLPQAPLLLRIDATARVAIKV
jgi:O-methyltransferase